MGVNRSCRHSQDMASLFKERGQDKLFFIVFGCMISTPSSSTSGTSSTIARRLRDMDQQLGEVKWGILGKE